MRSRNAAPCGPAACAAARRRPAAADALAAAPPLQMAQATKGVRSRRRTRACAACADGSRGRRRAEAEEAATQLLYRFPAKLSLATGHTMMVPFVDREVTAARTWLYQPDTAARRPLAAVRAAQRRRQRPARRHRHRLRCFGRRQRQFRRRCAAAVAAQGHVQVRHLRARFEDDIRREDQGVSRPCSARPSTAC